MNITQIIKNAGSTYAGMVVGTVSALVLTPVIVHRLGSEAFGLWVVTQSISSYFGLLDLGITSASVKYISQHRALGDKKSLNDLIETSFTCYCTLAAVSLLIALLLVPHATTIFHAHSGETVKLLILSVGVISALGFLSVIPTQCTIAAQRQDLLNCCLVVIDLV
ncbi:MAG TPA: hypothetical protein V6C72_11655, partial [Chroococcales cyanobacterium]